MKTHCAWVWLVAAACGGDSGEDTQVVMEPSESDDAGAPGPSPATDGGAGEEPTLREACETACQAQAACLGFSDTICADECAAQEASLPDGCQDEALAEQQCLAELSCEEARAYAVDGRRDHPVCGAQAEAYFAACTLGAGSLPAECTALCARFAECDVLEASEVACAESCTLEASTFDAEFGAACSAALLSFNACAARAECAEVAELYASELAPGGCDAELTAVEEACQ
jgi:hypothetical protein